MIKAAYNSDRLQWMIIDVMMIHTQIRHISISAENNDWCHQETEEHIE